jgi:hypothetical protein
MSVALMWVALFFGGLGYAAGVVFFRGLRLNLDLYLSSATGRAAAFHLLRLVAAAGFFASAAMAGAAPALAALLGFLAARGASVRSARIAS